MILPDEPKKRNIRTTKDPKRRKHSAAATITEDECDDLREIVNRVCSTKDGGNSQRNGHVGTKSVEPLEGDTAGRTNGKLNPMSPEEPVIVEPASPRSHGSGSPLSQTAPPAASTNGHCKKAVIHQFSPKIAKWLGVPAAAVFHYMRWWCLRHGKYTGTYDDLLKVFPYLTCKQLQLIISKLTDESEYEPLLIRKWMRAQNRYAFLLANPKMKLKKFHTFDPEVAVRLKSVPCAVILDDLTRWVAMNDCDGELPEHYESPAQWARAHPCMPLRTVERCFAKLAGAGEIILVGRRGTANTPVWTIPLGEGKLDRWWKLHHWFKKERHQQKVIVETKFVYVPVLHDPDNYSNAESVAEPVENRGFWRYQKPKNIDENGSAKRSPPFAKR
jgi:hypothetical protein